MIYLNMIFALALDRLIFGQSPGWWSLAGSGLILGSAVYVAVQKQQSAALEEEGSVAGSGTEEEEIGMLSERGRGENRSDEETG